MWTDLEQNSAMMGLQATATKRQYETCTYGEGEIQTNCSPPKVCRWSTSTQVNSLVKDNKIVTDMEIGVKNNKTSNTTPYAPPPPPPTTNLSSSQPIVSLENSIAKLESVVIPGESWSPAEPIVDSIQKLQAVAVPGERWAGERSTLATTLLSADDLDEDDDDFEDDFEEEDTPVPSYSPIRYPCSPPRGYIPHGYPKPFSYSYSQQNSCMKQYFNRTVPPHYNNWNHYYTPPEAASPQQTIRCAENGKSYLELGSASYNTITNMNFRNHKRCCDGKNNWCNTKQCYKERRLKMMNLSMFKLSRFRQISEQSLYRSVLICNTLKLIEKEMEMENKENTMTISSSNNSTLLSSSSTAAATTTTTITTNTTSSTNESNVNKLNTISSNYCIRVNGASNSNNNNNNNSNNNSSSNSSNNTSSSNNNNNNNNNNNSNLNPIENLNSNGSQDVFSNIRPTTPAPSFNTNNNNNNNNNLNETQNTNSTYDNQHHHPFRDSGSGRATPFPMLGLPDNDSGYGDEDCTRPINWGSVLSLSSQSALDPLNNNDLFTSITSSCNSITNSTTSYWDYNIFESDLGLDSSDLTELLPSWKLTPLSADDILKSVPPPMEPSKIMHDNEIDTFTHIMVGS